MTQVGHNCSNSLSIASCFNYVLTNLHHWKEERHEFHNFSSHLIRSNILQTYLLSHIQHFFAKYFIYILQNEIWWFQILFYFLEFLRQLRNRYAKYTFCTVCIYNTIVIVVVVRWWFWVSTLITLFFEILKFSTPKKEGVQISIILWNKLRIFENIPETFDFWLKLIN